MMLGLGCDLCDVARIRRAMENPRFLARIYTPKEQEHIARRGSETAAGLFAAKEAVSKALGTGFRGFGFQNIEILPDDVGRPVCSLTGGAQERLKAMGGRCVWVSISHSGGFAMATAVAEGGDK